MKPSNLRKRGAISWLQDHLENFVKPYLGFIPNEGTNLHLTPHQMTVIKNIWRSTKNRAKLENKIIVLPGRDVFIFEILARRENVPTIFIPECSRQTAYAIKLPIPREKAFILDTGFMGTIPLAMKVDSFSMVSTDKGLPEYTQVFPRLTLARNLALEIEKTPKYWDSGRLGEDGKEVLQSLSNKDEFEQAAKLTIAIYKDSSPKVIQGRKPLCLDHSLLNI